MSGPEKPMQALMWKRFDSLNVPNVKKLRSFVKKFKDQSLESLIIRGRSVSQVGAVHVTLAATDFDFHRRSTGFLRRTSASTRKTDARGLQHAGPVTLRRPTAHAQSRDSGVSVSAGARGDQLGGSITGCTLSYDHFQDDDSLIAPILQCHCDALRDIGFRNCRTLVEVTIRSILTLRRTGVISGLTKLKELHGSIHMASPEIATTLGRREVQWMIEPYSCLTDIELLEHAEKVLKRVPDNPHLNLFMKHLPAIDICRDCSSGHSGYIMSRPLFYNLLHKQVPAHKIYMNKRVQTISETDDKGAVETAFSATYHGQTTEVLDVEEFPELKDPLCPYYPTPGDSKSYTWVLFSTAT
ncbi:MAG: hypothetical protein J3R72DRAFT_486834 [Linnemannia gamsii]|nr:MAG: hypothetical protein J3R72DRAFT_486834 [Linnemannia gamsii]